MEKGQKETKEISLFQNQGRRDSVGKVSFQFFRGKKMHRAENI